MRMETSPARDVECSNAFRRVHLVAGNREQIAADGLDIDGNLSSRLDGVGVKPYLFTAVTQAANHLADLFDRLNRADLVIRGHH